MFSRPNTAGRITRRRSSAGPTPPLRPIRPREEAPTRSTVRPTFLTLRDHGKVFVADLPRLSDGQLANVQREARDVLESLTRRLQDLDNQMTLTPMEQDTRIRASTKRDVTERFIRAVEEEQDQRRSNPALRAAAGESLARAFLELARHRLSGATFDSLLQEALAACEPAAEDPDHDPSAPVEASNQRNVVQLVRPHHPPELPQPRPAAMPVVLTPDPSDSMP